MTVLSVRGLTKRFGGVTAVSALDLDVAAGERVALIGPNGAGKSTCFNLIGGQLRADAGRIQVFGRDVAGLAPEAICRLGVGRTFQVAAAFASMTVAEAVQMALIAHAGRAGAAWPAARRLYRDDAHHRLAAVGMADHAGRACGVLAYGDLKRLELALALAGDPRLLLMDEPTAGMAPGERQALMGLVVDLAGAGDVALVFTEHDMDVVFAHAARIVVLDRGVVVADGEPEAVRADPRVQAVYLGGTFAAAAAG